MNDQAPPGWYPDGRGSERYWNGTSWSDQFRELGPASQVGGAVPRKEGALSRMRKASADRKAAMHAAQEELERQWAEAAEAAGTLVTTGVFGTSTIELYDRGYVRVATAGDQAQRPASITPDMPYEKLLSIKFGGPSSNGGSNSGEATALTKGASQLMKHAGLVKGGSGLLKGSVPGLVATGLTQVVAAKAGKSFLTITTDRKIHTLTNQVHNGFINTSNRGHNDVGFALEAAAATVLGAGVPVQQVIERVVPQIQSLPSAPQSVSDRLRELANLHKEGILSAEEFASAKARLIDTL